MEPGGVFASPFARVSTVLSVGFLLTSCVLNNAKSLESQGFPAFIALFWCKGFSQICEKPLHLPIHMVRMRIGYALISV